MVLLFLAFGSVLLPIKAVLMNLVSIGTSFGVLVWIFQDGHLADWLGFTPTGFLEPTIPMLILAVLFGLATDYEVFLLSRGLVSTNPPLPPHQPESWPRSVRRHSGRDCAGRLAHLTEDLCHSARLALPTNQVWSDSARPATAYHTKPPPFPISTWSRRVVQLASLAP